MRIDLSRTGRRGGGVCWEIEMSCDGECCLPVNASIHLSATSYQSGQAQGSMIPTVDWLDSPAWIRTSSLASGKPAFYFSDSPVKYADEARQTGYGHMMDRICE